MAVGDLNGDGTPDVVVDDGPTVTVLLGNGDGTFQTGQNYGVAPGGSTWIAVGNFDTNAGLDLAAGLDVYDKHESDFTFYDNCLITMSGNGDGTLFGPPIHSLGSQHSPSRVHSHGRR